VSRLDRPGYCAPKTAADQNVAEISRSCRNDLVGRNLSGLGQKNQSLSF
jgi:hypothetical protein